MGCVQSRKDINDVHPNVFRVINLDECGAELWAGQLEVTDLELALYRRRREPTRWPLRSLRRYGFDAETFSFESGRRCTTGEGIYAFKCRRAEQLFNTLQQCIQARNLNPEGVGALESLALEAGRPPSTLPRPPPQPAQHPDYLVPALPAPRPSRFSGTIRLGSVGSGPMSPEVHSPGSPSSANILEVMPLNPLPSGGAHVTNLYHSQDFSLQQREHNNNRKIKPDSTNHSYSNTSDVSLDSDLATLRHSLLRRQFTQNDEDAAFIETVETINPSGAERAPLSPTPSTASERYATLSVEEANSRLYMNLTLGDAGALPAIREENGVNGFEYNYPLTTPDAGNFNFVDLSHIIIEEEKHDYINLGPGEVNYDPRLLIRQPSKPPPGIVMPPIDPAKEEAVTEINYAVLDLSKSQEEEIAEGAGAALPPSSPKKPAIGYTTIDFNKTVALTSVALGTEVDTEGSRKTRHNSTALPPSPTVT